MDATPIIRYAELIDGFTAEELHRLPLALEVYADLPSLIEAMCSGEATYAAYPDLERATLLLKEMAKLLRSEAIERRDDSLFGRVFRKHWAGRLTRLQEEREAKYSELVREYFFIATSFELNALISTAYLNALSMQPSALGIPDSILEGHRDRCEKSNRAIMVQIRDAFASVDARYELEQGVFEPIGR